jgi:ubiquinone/menaquinone biosynthesis C-methylase UbiE
VADSRPVSGFGFERGKVFPAAHARSLLNPLRRLVQSPERAVAAIGIEPHDRVLELGCGPGYFSPALARATSGGVVLLDLQAEMLELARERVPERLSFRVQADGARLPFADASFDVVFVATVLGEIPDRGACLDEVRRIVRLDGVLAIAETRRDSDFIALPVLKSLTAERGFRFAEKRGVGWQYVALFRPTER